MDFQQDDSQEMIDDIESNGEESGSEASSDNTSEESIPQSTAEQHSNNRGLGGLPNLKNRSMPQWGLPSNLSSNKYRRGKKEKEASYSTKDNTMKSRRIRKTKDSTLDLTKGKSKASSVKNLLKSKGTTNIEAKAVKKLSTAGGLKGLKIKLIIIGVCLAVAIVFMLLIAVLIELKIIDPEDLSGSSMATIDRAYGDSSSYWWPVGSIEETNINGIVFAAGTPPDTYISSEFGNRVHPISGETKFHNGIDISGGGIGGKYAIATKAGKVEKVATGCNDNSTLCDGMGYGNYVYIAHNDGSYTRYAHLQRYSITVKKGDSVEQGQVIGKIGTTGSSTGNHLHFEIIINGSAVNPLNYVSKENPRTGYREPSQGGGSSFDLSGSSNMQNTCIFFKQKGYSDVGISAVMTNIDFESGYNENAINELQCLGITQWCFGRANNLKNTYGKSWNVLENQLEFLAYELDSSSYSYIKDYINSSSSPTDSTYYYCMHFEVPGVSYCRRRRDSGKSAVYLSYAQNNCG